MVPEYPTSHPTSLQHLIQAGSSHVLNMDARTGWCRFTLVLYPTVLFKAGPWPAPCFIGSGCPKRDSSEAGCPFMKGYILYN